jgi:DMSO reductase family type II enzyme heme b subunit
MVDPATGLGHPQNIVAGGAGTVQTTPDSDLLPIIHSQSRSASGWVVIIQRPLVNASANGNMVTLARAKSYRICFAQWNGAFQERNGTKMVAGSWQTLFVQ